MQTKDTTGKKLGSFGIDRLYILQQFVVWGFVAGILLLLLRPGFPVLAYPLFWLLAYVGTILALELVYTRLELYENGVMVVSGERRSMVYWKDIRRVDGARHTYSVNMIPVARWGANKFYNDTGEAFQIGAYTASATPLMNFIVMKQVEPRIPGEIKKIEQGTLFTYGRTNLSADGIEKDGTFYRWSEIRGLNMNTWSSTSLTLVLKNGRSVKLGSMEGTALYTFVAIFDHYMNSKFYVELQRDTIEFGRRVRQTSRNVIWLVAVVVGLTIAGIALITGIFVVSELAK